MIWKPFDRPDLLTSLRQKRCMRWNILTRRRFSHSRETRRHRHTIDASQCVAREAEATHHEGFTINI
jgi:hypothetical protein